MKYKIHSAYIVEGITRTLVSRKLCTYRSRYKRVFNCDLKCRGYLIFDNDNKKYCPYHGDGTMYYKKGRGLR